MRRESRRFAMERKKKKEKKEKRIGEE